MIPAYLINCRKYLASVKWGDMHDVETVLRNLIEITEVRLACGWRGWVAVREAGRERFSKSGWESLLAEPEKLLEGSGNILKSEGDNVVMIKYLATGGRGVKAVIKRHRRGRGLREFFRSLGAARGLRNFIGAVKTRQYGLPVAAPLAGLYHRKNLLCDQSIYISEYMEGANLYEFLKNMRADNGERHRIMCRLSERMAEIFAGLHENNLWHRDAKASNFVVYKDGQDNYCVALTDMDGVKQYIFRRKTCQMRPFWQLAASVMNLPNVYRTDYLRVFTAYCEKVGIPVENRRAIYYEVAGLARAKDLRNKQKYGGRI